MNHKSRKLTINGVKVLLINPQDKLSKSYISVDVNVGSKTDPWDFEGFTHLIEHMLFTGSKNYPEPDLINKIVHKYNG
jgi:secreted Zn-dependent insulinase-like peptidase